MSDREVEVLRQIPVGVGWGLTWWKDKPGEEVASAPLVPTSRPQGCGLFD